MELALSLVSILLQYLPTIETGASELWQFITNVRDAAQQISEWTDDLETAFQAKLLASRTDPAYQPDAVVNQTAPPAVITDTGPAVTVGTNVIVH